MTQNFRVAAHDFGVPLRVLRFEAALVPEVAPGAALVRMLTSPINPSDLIPVTGAYRHRTTLPFVPGFEGVGVVEGVGQGVDPTLVGSRVVPLTGAGGWQSWRSVPSECCIRVPDDIGDDQAALAYVNPLTALLMVRRLAPRPGDRIGVTAAGSAIGWMLMRMLAGHGAEPIAIVSSADARDALVGQFGDVFVDGDRLPRLSAGLDAVGGQTGARLAAAIRSGGLLLHYGLLSGQPLRAAGPVTASLFHLRDWVRGASRPALHEAMAESFDEIRAGRATSRISQVYPLWQFEAALTHHAQRNRGGKILLRL